MRHDVQPKARSTSGGHDSLSPAKLCIREYRGSRSCGARLCLWRQSWAGELVVAAINASQIVRRDSFEQQNGFRQEREQGNKVKDRSRQDTDG